MIFQRQISYIILILLSVTIFLSVIYLCQINLVYGKPYANIDVVTANNMISNGTYPNLVILDVRTQSEYNEGHLENAVLIPLNELESRLGKILPCKDSEIIVYCKSGARSAQASYILDSNNFTKVFNVLGGITAWESANYPVIHEFPSWIMLLVFLVATLCVIVTLIVIYRKRMKKVKDKL